MVRSRPLTVELATTVPLEPKEYLTENRALKVVLFSFLFLHFLLLFLNLHHDYKIFYNILCSKVLNCLTFRLLGTFSSNTNNKLSAECSQCTKGSYCDSPGSVRAKSSCSAGFWCGEGVDTPTPGTCFLN